MIATRRCITSEFTTIRTDTLIVAHGVLLAADALNSLLALLVSVDVADSNRRIGNSAIPFLEAIVLVYSNQRTSRDIVLSLYGTAKHYQEWEQREWCMLHDDTFRDNRGWALPHGRCPLRLKNKGTVFFVPFCI